MVIVAKNGHGDTITIIKLRWQHGLPWPSFFLSPSPCPPSLSLSSVPIQFPMSFLKAQKVLRYRSSLEEFPFYSISEFRCPYVHLFVHWSPCLFMRMLTLLSVDDISLPRYVNRPTYYKDLLLNEKMISKWWKHMNSVWYEFT